MTVIDAPAAPATGALSFRSLRYGASYCLALLLRPHPEDRKRGLLLEEEARAERLTNLIRIVYLAAWLLVTAWIARTNVPVANLINLAGGGAWMACALAYHLWLLRRPYHPSFKYVATIFDIAAVTTMIVAYALMGGGAFALKMPINLNYFCCLGLVALRLHRRLAIYAGTLTVGAYLVAWFVIARTVGLTYGDGVAHAATDSVNAKYLAFNTIYLAVFGLLVYAAAVNVRRMLDLRAAEARRALRARERAVMAAGVAHEIRNPLAGIHGAARLLRDADGADSRLAAMILEDSERLNGVVEGFLRFSRPFPLRPRVTDVAALVRDFCRSESMLFPDVPLACRPGERSLPVRTDPEAVRQILSNLVRNARKVQPSGRALRLSMEAERGIVLVHVEDEGPGIAPNRMEDLFEPFRTGTTDGTGVGLALSRKIARELGGDLTYVPLHPGSRFTLRLQDHDGRDVP